MRIWNVYIPSEGYYEVEYLTYATMVSPITARGIGSFSALYVLGVF